MMRRHPTSPLVTGNQSTERTRSAVQTEPDMRVGLLRRRRVMAENAPKAKQRLPDYQHTFNTLKEQCRLETYATSIEHIENTYKTGNLSDSNRIQIESNSAHLQSNIVKLNQHSRTVALWLPGLPRPGELFDQFNTLGQEIKALLAQIQALDNRLAAIATALAAEDDYPAQQRQLLRLKVATDIDLLTLYVTEIEAKIAQGHSLDPAELKTLDRKIEDATSWKTLLTNFETTLNFVLSIVPVTSLFHEKYKLIAIETRDYVTTLQTPETRQALNDCVQKLKDIQLQVTAQINLAQHEKTAANIERNCNAEIITAYLEKNKSRFLAHNTLNSDEYKRLQYAIATYDHLSAQASSLMIMLQSECQNYPEDSAIAAQYEALRSRVEVIDDATNRFYNQLLAQQTCYENSFATAFAAINEELDPHALMKTIEALNQNPTAFAVGVDVAAAIRYRELSGKLLQLFGQVNVVDNMMTDERKEAYHWVQLKKAITTSIKLITHYQQSLDNRLAQESDNRCEQGAPISQPQDGSDQEISTSCQR